MSGGARICATPDVWEVWPILYARVFGAPIRQGDWPPRFPLTVELRGGNRLVGNVVA